ncbi:amidohydrolase family protein [Microbacterium ulmi]
MEVGAGLEVDAAERVDATGQIVLPGLIDTHRHTWQTALRGFGADFTAQEYRSCIRGSFGMHMRPEDVYASTLLGALEALDSGITTMVDWAHIMNTPEHADASIDALVDSGIRAVFGYGTPNDDETMEWYQQSTRHHPPDARRIREGRLSSDDALVTMALATRPPHIVTRETMINDWRLADELGLRVTTDGGLGGGSWNGVLWGPGGHEPIRALAREGLLNERTTFVHCNNIPDDELRLIADAGASISISPDSELHVGHCFPVTGRAVSLGIRPSLSIDIVIQVAGDLFGAMRSILVSDRGEVGARHYAEGSGPASWEITTKDVLEFATVAGASAVGMASRTGSISPGKKADLVLLAPGALNLEPMNNAIGLVVLQAHPGNVESVYVGGRAVKQNGSLAAPLRERAIALARSSRDHLFASARLEPGWGYKPLLQPQWRW